MGNSQSAAAKDEIRRSNRLSKPLTKKFNAYRSSQRPETDPTTSPELIGWQNPWVQQNASIPATPAEKRGSYPKRAEIPPTLFETDSSEETSAEERAFTFDQISTPRHLSGPTVLTASSSRRTSYQSERWDPASPASSIYEQPLRRASSTRVGLQRHSSVVYETHIGDATSSNTHFLVGNQRFSLTRRRSLLTRPGVATRRTASTLRRVPSPIGEPECPIEDPTESTVLHWPLPSTLQLPPPARPTSPTDARYTQLGALKLGSLRVVNGSASPCPSERIPLPSVSGPGLGLENVDVVKVTRPSRASTLEIPVLPDLKKSDDLPGSPFSFEKSPVLATPSRTKSLFPPDSDDEGIVLCDDTRIQLEKGVPDADLARSVSHSLNKSDSGYSSATSVHSIQRSRTQSSTGSQTSGSCATDSSKNASISNGSLSNRPGDKVQRHLSLQSTPENYSRPYPSATRWYDPSDPSPLTPLRSRRSTLCAPRYTEYPARESILGVDYTAGLALPCQNQQGLTRGPFYGDRLSLGSSDIVSTEASSLTEVHLKCEQAVTESKERLRRSASEYGFRAECEIHRSRSRSRLGSRIWTMKPGVDAPPLPTITSPGYLQDDLDLDVELEPEPIRGRPRSRSNDPRRRRLTKSRPQSDLFI
ncbi:uncharacterized protein N7515_006194 [Penicillium bovifimosum]|uniref:Uncharacterized protein n=1 Tax=Penicillium bovifimosum TaxID=126998 RepID=A0A9W9GU63_9EURO|nr:uncharacterized protein N7515_006194 [Penicillium bovifimosum]KAJ5130155.1 hypothetical protein N7515_006194 [Penicillium bovifimosum]